MNEEEFDKMVGGALPPVAISDERLDHFIDAVLDRAALDSRKAPAARSWSWPRLTVLAPALRFALPLAVATLLGLTVSGQFEEEDQPLAQFSTLYLSTMLAPVGS